MADGKVAVLHDLKVREWQRWRDFEQRDRQMAKVHFLSGEERPGQRSNARRGAEWIQKQRVSGAGATVLR